MPEGERAPRSAVPGRRLVGASRAMSAAERWPVACDMVASLRSGSHGQCNRKHPKRHCNDRAIVDGRANHSGAPCRARCAAIDTTVKGLGDCRHDSPLAELLYIRRSSHHWVDASDRVLLDDTAAMVAARGVRRGRAARLRGRRPAAQDLLRPVQDARRHRHLRRAVPGPQQRHPRARDGAHARTTACAGSSASATATRASSPATGTR